MKAPQILAFIWLMLFPITAAVVTVIVLIYDSCNGIIPNWLQWTWKFTAEEWVMVIVGSLVFIGFVFAMIIHFLL